MRSVREMRKIQSKEGAFKKARENTAPIEVQNHEPVPAEDNFANVNENEEFELPVDPCDTEFQFSSTALNCGSTEFEFGSTAVNSGNTAINFDIPANERTISNKAHT